MRNASLESLAPLFTVVGRRQFIWSALAGLMCLRQFEEAEQYRAHKFDETRLDEFVDTLRKDLQIYDGLNPHTDSTDAHDGEPTVAATRGDASAKWMNSLASLIASYRQMRGPYESAAQ